MVISPRFRGVVVVRSIVALAIDFEDAIDDLPDRWRFWQSRPMNGSLHRIALAIASGPVRPAVTTFDHVP